MNGMVLLLALAAPGIDYGWRPGADGQLEYIVQLEPELVEALRSGREVRSDIHPQARNMRRFILRQGTGELPQVTGETARVARLGGAGSSVYSQFAPHNGSDPNSSYMVQSARPPNSIDSLPSGVETGWRPSTDGQMEYIIQLDRDALDELKQGEEINGEIDPEVSNIGRLLIRFGSDPLPRVSTANLVASDRSGTSGVGNVMRTQGHSASWPPNRTPNDRYSAGVGSASGQATAQGSTRDSRNETVSSQGSSAPRNSNSSPSTTQDSRQSSSGTTGGRAATSPWSDAANPSAVLSGQPTPGRGTTGGSGDRSGNHPGLLQAPPTDGYRYSMNDQEEDLDDEWTIARAGDEGWQEQRGAPGQAYFPDRDANPYDRSTYPPEDGRRSRAGERDPYGDRVTRPDAQRQQPPDWRDDRRSIESERYASAATSSGSDRVTRASAETGSDREMALLQRDLALERLKSMEREMAERDRTLASIAARTVRRTESTDDDSTATRTAARTRESGQPELTSPSSTTNSTRSPASDRSGELLKELILFASLGMNIVAVLIARQYYMRYRMLIREMRDPDSLAD